MHLQLSLPLKKQRFTCINPQKNYVNVYFGLTSKQAEKFKKLTKKEKKSESEVLRAILARFIYNMEKKKVGYRPCRKTSPQGLKTLPRTICKEQNKKLRELSEKTGRSLSELVREAVEKY